MTILPIVSETVLRLRRDRIFLPAMIVGIGLLLFSGLASFWGVEEFYKILYDLGTTAYQLTGVLVAIFWGSKIISDSKQEGSLEVQLASPVGRTEWLIAKYLGLCVTLVVLAIVFLIGWQLVYSAYGIGFMGWNSVGIFGILTLSWLTMGAVAMFFASSTGYAVALFASVWLMICGLLTAPIMQSMAPDTPETVKTVVSFLAGVWNLHYFNLYEFGAKKEFISNIDILKRCLYAGSLITFFLSLAAFSFRKKDLTGS